MPDGKYWQPTVALVTCGLTDKDPGSAPEPYAHFEYGATISTFNPRVYPNEIIGVHVLLNMQHNRLFK